MEYFLGTPDRRNILVQFDTLSNLLSHYPNLQIQKAIHFYEPDMQEVPLQPNINNC